MHLYAINGTIHLPIWSYFPDANIYRNPMAQLYTRFIAGQGVCSNSETRCDIMWTCNGIPECPHHIVQPDHFVYLHKCSQSADRDKTSEAIIIHRAKFKADKNNTNQIYWLYNWYLWNDRSNNVWWQKRFLWSNWPDARPLTHQNHLMMIHIGLVICNFNRIPRQLFKMVDSVALVLCYILLLSCLRDHYHLHLAIL